MNSKAACVPGAYHTLNLFMVDSAKSLTDALTFFGALTKIVCTVLSICTTLGHSEETY